MAIAATWIAEPWVRSWRHGLPRRWRIIAPMALALATGTMAPALLAQTFPLEIEHRFGTSTIEQRPERVATVDYTGADNLLALGVQPVVVRTEPGEPIVAPWAESLLTSSPAALRGGLDFEIIAAARPDVIIALWSGISRAEYERLSKIAPVVAVPPGVGDYALAWDEIALRTGRAIGRESHARESVEALRERFGAVRAAHPDWQDRTASIAYYQPGVLGAYSASDVRGRLLSQLGLQLPPPLAELADEGTAIIELSEERIDLIDADVVLWGAFGELDAIRDLALRDALTAADEGREIYVDRPLWYAMGFASLLSLPITLDRLVPKIEAAIDGDPETAVSDQ